MTRRIVHLFDSPGTNESRFLREARSALGSGIADEVLLVCRWETELELEEQPEPGIRINRIKRWLQMPVRHPLLGILRFADLQRRFALAAIDAAPIAIHCHSLVPLPASVHAGSVLGIPVLYDAHELETETNGLRGARRVFDKAIESQFIGRCDAVVCVSDAIADWYAARYGIDRPDVVRNVPDFDLSVEPRRTGLLRRALGLTDEALIFLYQGGLFRGRRIEQMLRVFSRMPGDRHLVCMGYGELASNVRAAAELYPNIHLMSAVPPDRLLEYTSDADVGIVGVQDICMSYRLSLPNKFFEYVAAGVPSLMPAYPEMQRAASRLHCAITVGESDEDWHESASSLTRRDLGNLKAAAAKARRIIRWKDEAKVLLKAYARVGLTSKRAAL